MGRTRNVLLIPTIILIILVVAQLLQCQRPKRATILVLGEDHPTGACLTKLHTLDHELDHFPYPSDWKLVVACTSVSWEQALRRAGFPPTHTAYSGLKPRVTVLNGASFNEQPAFYEHTLAHELGHIRCHCQPESTAEDVGMKFLKSKEFLVGLAAPDPNEDAPTVTR